jgi:hypothetical protein
MPSDGTNQTTTIGIIATHSNPPKFLWKAFESKIPNKLVGEKRGPSYSFC